MSASLFMASISASPFHRGINMDHIFDPYNDSKEPISEGEPGEMKKALNPEEFLALKKRGV